jgi:hypothetical protein
VTKVFHVVPVASRWTITEEAGAEAAPSVDNVAAAEQLAIETAQALQRAGEGAKVVVHSDDGGVRATHEFPSNSGLLATAHNL